MKCSAFILFGIFLQISIYSQKTASWGDRLNLTYISGSFTTSITHNSTRSVSDLELLKASGQKRTGGCFVSMRSGRTDRKPLNR